ncbi:hypothetical protein MTQ00_08225 [Chryseobacterium sp. B21-037]|jgi:hypothetical protein|uniref:hypothetical protein n=1 Tax=Chryseobacterium sp. B21-037 TaxID=2926038 RepID=UPI0023592C5D|nr:hypothetical protein [Chryseobacterium sp. B21-037]MDC8104523.1 hypothetical protein [Chryseobacterium sp. B21-037]
MEINRRIFLIISFFILTLVSCQTKKVILYEKYENLDSEKKSEVDEYLTDAKKLIPKKESEIILMFQYNCFFDKSLKLNNGYETKFPKISNKNHYGQRFAAFEKKNGNIKISLSNGRKFLINQKDGYDYIGVCYNEKESKLYIEYFDYPHMLVLE